MNVARWRLEKHDFCASYWLTIRRYTERADKKISISQFYSDPHGAGFYKTVSLDFWDCWNYPDTLDFLIESLTDWQQEIRRRKGGKRYVEPADPAPEMAP